MRRRISKKYFHSNLTMLLLTRAFLFTLIVFSVSLTQFCNIAAGQEKLAVIARFTGDVKVQHEDTWLEVKNIGPRIMNSSLFQGDLIKTGTGSSADILYDDGSLITIEENTSLGFKSRVLSDVDKAETKKEAGRMLSLTEGKLIFNITPSKTVLTEFETPTGVASVRGTMGFIDYDFSTLTATYGIDEGFLSYDAVNDTYSFDMGAGLIIKIKTTVTAGQISTLLTVEGGSVTLNTQAGLTIELEKDNAISITTTFDESGTPQNQIITPLSGPPIIIIDPDGTPLAPLNPGDPPLQNLILAPPATDNPDPVITILGPEPEPEQSPTAEIPVDIVEKVSDYEK